MELLRNGEAELNRRDCGAAQRSFDQALIIFRRIGDDSPMVALCQSNLGAALMLEGKSVSARVHPSRNVVAKKMIAAMSAAPRTILLVYL